MTSRGCLTRFRMGGVQEKCHLRKFASDLNICFQRIYPLNLLPPETRQSFTHHVDHRLRRPPIATIIQEREREDLTIYCCDVPSQRNYVVGRSGFGVKVSLGWRISHPPPEELGVAGDWK